MIAAAHASMRLNTSGLPQGEALAAARELYGRQIMRVDVAPLEGVPLEVDLTLRNFPGLRMATGRFGHAHAERIPDRGGADELIVAAELAGEMIFRQRGHEVTLSPGVGWLGATAEHGISLHRGSEAVMMMIPKKGIASCVPRLDARISGPIPRQNEAWQLLLAYLRLVLTGEALDSAALCTPIIDHIHDLVALALGAERDGRVLAAGRGLKAARLQAIKAQIAERIGPRPVSAEDVAARFGISERYVRKLFEAEGTSFSAYVAEQRLRYAWRMLRSPRHSARSISDIAYEAGFGDLSYFNRLFRRMFGATPSEVRAEGMR